MGAELVRLAALGRVDISDGRIVVKDPTPTGDSQLDAALASLAGDRRSARAWVARTRRDILKAHLTRLADGAAGDAAVEAASSADVHAAVNAAHSAAVHAAVHAANHAAAHAAAHQAGGGADFGGHHGH
jgi:Golgi phosphoprotein 3 (GPP34)